MTKGPAEGPAEGLAEGLALCRQSPVVVSRR